MVCCRAHLGCFSCAEKWVNFLFPNSVFDADSFSRFKSAWCSVWEKEQCTEIFGEADVTADSLPELADKIIAASN